MPFKVGNKFVFGAKFTTFVVVGFSLPFVGVWWQKYASGFGLLNTNACLFFFFSYSASTRHKRR